MISLANRLAIAAFCVLALPGVAPAQASASADSTDSRANASSPIPTLMALPPDSMASFRPARPDIAPVVRRQALDRPTVLMIVGGALIVTGLIVGDDASTILYLAGAGIGAYGLYLYLQSPTTRLTR